MAKLYSKNSLRSSSSIIVTLALLRSPRMTWLGNELEIMTRLNASGPSNISSSVILILKLARVTPAGNTTGCNPKL